VGSIGPVIPVIRPPAYRRAVDVASVQFSRTVERRIRRPTLGSRGRALCATAPSPAGAGLSKLNSMPGLVLRTGVARLQVARRPRALARPARFGRRARPDRASPAGRSGARKELRRLTAGAIGAP